jgi:hypothetical protein
MRDFNSYEKNQTTKQGLNGDAMNSLRNFAGKYEGASETDLISAIMLEAEKGRKNGTLSDADVDNFANMIAPMLNPSQKAKLKAVVNKIKNIKNVEDCVYKSVNELGESSILYLLEIKTNAEFKRQVKRDSLKQVLLGLEEHKIEVPYNQLDIHQKK